MRMLSLLPVKTVYLTAKINGSVFQSKHIHMVVFVQKTCLDLMFKGFIAITDYSKVML